MIVDRYCVQLAAIMALVFAIMHLYLNVLISLIVSVHFFKKYFSLMRC